MFAEGARTLGVGGTDAIKARLRKAEQVGLWTTSTPGKPGQPSSLAYQLVKDN